MRQWSSSGPFSPAGAGRGRTVREAVIEGRLDVTPVFEDPAGTGEQILDFLAQARTGGLAPAARRLLLEHLDRIALPGPGRVVPHPLHVAVVTR